MNDEIGDSVREYFEFLFDKLDKLVIEDIPYSDYDQMTDWVGEIRNHVRRIEKKQVPTYPIHKEKTFTAQIAIIGFCGMMPFRMNGIITVEFADKQLIGRTKWKKLCYYN